MSILTRLLNRFRRDRLDRDLHEEVQFHLDRRADAHMHAGLNREEAMKRAREQFGDVDKAKRGMRRARLSSVTTLVAMASLLAVVAVIWISQARLVDIPMPVPPEAPLAAPLWFDRDAPGRTPPPPPPPPPTREQCLEQAKKVPRICG
jgi:hypothetical protein